MSRLLLISVALLALTSSLVRAEDGVEEETTTTTPETPAKPQGYVPPTQSSAYDVPWQDMDTFLANRSLAIVVIYSHECPACMNYMPEFDQAVEAYHAAIDPKADSGLVFVRVNGLDGSTDWTMDHSITAFPTVRLFANGAFVKKNLHETARSAADITTMFQRMNARMLSRASPTIAREQDLDKIFKEVVMEERRTLVVAQFASEEAPSDADPGEKASSCRVAFAAGMAELVDLDYFTVHTTRVDGVSKAARSKIEVHITLKGFIAQHPDLTTVCTTYSLITILRCSGATSTSPCKVVGASMPIPSTTDELVRALVTHGVPEAVQMTPATAPLLTKIWMDRSIPQSSRGLHPRRIEQRTRPTFVYFAELKACEEDTPEYKWAKYIKRTVRSIAVDYPNITLMVADQYEFSTLYLRLGFNRQDSRDGIVMGIYADGLRYSSHSLNFTKFEPEIIREFLDAFNSGQLEPYITSVKYSKKTEGPIKIAGQMSSIGFFNTLWRVGEPVPTPPPRGGVEDVFLVVVAHKRCFHCGAIIDNFEKLIDARNRRVARTGGAVAGSAQFLTIPRDNSIAKDAPAKRVDIDLDAVVNGATTEANAKGLVLERLVPIFINGTENYPATEMWQPTLTSNLRPIIGTCVRVSQVAYKDGKPYWEVTAHAPGFMDFTSNRFAHSPPTAMHLLDLIVSEWDRHVNFGQTVVRAEK